MQAVRKYVVQIAEWLPAPEVPGKRRREGAADSTKLRRRAGVVTSFIEGRIVGNYDVGDLIDRGVGAGGIGVRVYGPQAASTGPFTSTNDGRLIVD